MEATVRTLFEATCIFLLVGFLMVLGFEGLMGVNNILYLVRWH